MKGVLNYCDQVFAWYPVRLSAMGDIRGRIGGKKTHWCDTGKWAWLRKVWRWRGLYIGTLYTEEKPPELTTNGGRNE